MWRDQGSAELAVTGHHGGAGLGPEVQGSPSLALHDCAARPLLPGQPLDSSGPPATPGPGPEVLSQGLLQAYQRQAWAPSSPRSWAL